MHIKKSRHIFLDRIEHDFNNQLLADFIDEKFRIINNATYKEAWEVTKPPTEKYGKGTLRLNKLLSTGNRLAFHEFNFINDFTQKYAENINDFKKKKQHIAGTTGWPLPYDN